MNSANKCGYSATEFMPCAKYSSIFSSLILVKSLANESIANFLRLTITGKLSSKMDNTSNEPYLWYSAEKSSPAKT